MPGGTAQVGRSGFFGADVELFTPVRLTIGAFVAQGRVATKRGAVHDRQRLSFVERQRKELVGGIEQRGIERRVNAVTGDVHKPGLMACPQQISDTRLAIGTKRIMAESSDINNRKRSHWPYGTGRPSPARSRT